MKQRTSASAIKKPDFARFPLDLRQCIPIWRFGACAVLECRAIFQSTFGALRVYFRRIRANGSSSPGGALGNLASFLPIILMFVVLYFLMIRPQMKRQKEQKAMMDALGKGDEVVTSGGVLGRITKVSDAYITIEVSEGTEMIVQKGAITTLLPKGTMRPVRADRLRAWCQWAHR
jgi:preprotein translocase subunit YajC